MVRTLTEFNNVLQNTGFPVAYRAFPAQIAPAMPFIIYQDTGSNNIGADNIVWFSGMIVQIDLMCRLKCRSAEELLERILNDAGIYWERVAEFDDNEDYYRTTYEIEI